MKKFQFDAPELTVLRIICYAEYNRIRDRTEHAHSHGDTNYKDAHSVPLANIIQALENTPDTCS